MNLLANRIKVKFYAWLSRNLHDYTKRAVVASLDATAAIGTEGTVHNLAGDKDRLIVGAHSLVEGRLLIYGHGGRIQMGEWCYVGVRSEIWSMNSIIIGDRVVISHGVNIHDGTAHSKDPNQRHNHYRHMMELGHPRLATELPGVASAPIIIEDDVWINFGVTILKGVKIGKNSIIAAGSIVTKDVPADVLYRCEIKPIISPLLSGNSEGTGCQ